MVRVYIISLNWTSKWSIESIHSIIPEKVAYSNRQFVFRSHYFIISLLWISKWRHQELTKNKKIKEKREKKIVFDLKTKTEFQQHINKID